MRTEEIIKKEIVRRITIKVTDIDENIIIVLPKSVFKININKISMYDYKRFLNIEYQDDWVDCDKLSSYITKQANGYLGYEFTKICNRSDNHIGIHWDYDPMKEICLKEDESNYTILTKKIDIFTRIEYKKLF